MNERRKADPQWLCDSYCFELWEWDEPEWHVFQARHRFCYRLVYFEKIPGWSWGAMTYEQQSEVRMKFISKTKPSENGRPQQMAVTDEKWSALHPAIHEYMTATAYGDGSMRLTATVSFFVGPQGYTLVLQDRDVPRSLWASAATVAEVWKVLEELARRGEQAPWRADKRETGRTGRLDKRPG